VDDDVRLGLGDGGSHTVGVEWVHHDAGRAQGVDGCAAGLVAAGAEHLVAGFGQRGREAAAQSSGRAGDEDSHDPSPFGWGLAPSTGEVSCV
jgi:hypothetical protein